MSMTFYILKYARNIFLLVAALVNCSALFELQQCFLSYAEHFFSLTCKSTFSANSYCIWSSDELCAVRSVIAEKSLFVESCVADGTEDIDVVKVSCKDRDGQIITRLIYTHQEQIRQYKGSFRNGFGFCPPSFYGYRVVWYSRPAELFSVSTYAPSCQLNPDSRLFPRISLLDSIGMIEIVHPIFENFSPLMILLNQFGIDLRSRSSFESYSSQSHLIPNGASVLHPPCNRSRPHSVMRPSPPCLDHLPLP